MKGDPSPYFACLDQDKEREPFSVIAALIPRAHDACRGKAECGLIHQLDIREAGLVPNSRAFLAARSLNDGCSPPPEWRASRKAG